MAPRPVAAALTCLLALAMLSAGADVGHAKSLQVGASFVLSLKGNPGTGYTWRLNKAKSSNLASVSVADLGYGKGSSRKRGAPAAYRFRVTAKSPGVVKLVFDYLRPWEGRPVRSETRSVTISGR